MLERPAKAGIPRVGGANKSDQSCDSVIAGSEIGWRATWLKKTIPKIFRRSIPSFAVIFSNIGWYLGLAGQSADRTAVQSETMHLNKGVNRKVSDGEFFLLAEFRVAIKIWSKHKTKLASIFERDNGNYRSTAESKVWGWTKETAAPSGFIGEANRKQIRKGRERKGKGRKERKGKGKDGKGKEGRERKGNGKEGKGWKVRERKGREGKGRKGKWKKEGRRREEMGK